MGKLSPPHGSRTLIIAIKILLKILLIAIDLRKKMKYLIIES